jgi:putative DNA primase/helicase
MSAAEPLTVARWMVVERGLSVIALDHPDATRETDPKRIGKVPRTRWELFQRAHASDDNLKAWFGNGTPSNLAIVTGAVSNVVSIDGDSPEALEWMRAHLPPTEMRTKTARGEHWFYRHPGTPIPNKARLRIDGSPLAIDVRGDGGYVVGPTSKHATGTVYERLGSWPPVPELPAFDPAWIATPEPPAPTRPAPPSGVIPDREHLLRRARAYIARVPPAIEGQGGDTHTFQLACRLLRGFALDDGDVFDLMQEWNAGCQPPWTDRELEDKIRSARKHGKEPIGARAATAPPSLLHSEHQRVRPGPFACTDTGNAEAFAAWFGDQWRYDYQRGVWRHWETPVWATDSDGLVYRHAKAAMRRRFHETAAIEELQDRTATAKWAISSESRARLEACLFLATKETPIADAGDGWDVDPYLLACANGVLDLHSGDFRAGHQGDRLTMQTARPYEPAARCPRFERFMLEITGHDRALVDYLQRALGYSLTGDISEQCLWFVFGPGSGGKTTLLRTIGNTLGSYAYTAPFSTFLKDQHGNTVTNDLATLQGKRFVAASEVRERARLDEGRVKSLTGGDPMTARFLHQEFFTFRPTLHLWLAVNHKPVVTDDSYGFWRRVRLVPLTQRFPITPSLEGELQGEAAGILAWLVRGCLLWQAEGLSAPESVAAATAEYEEDSDPMTDFLNAECEVHPAATIGASEFYRLYSEWAERAGLSGRERLSSTAFGRIMTERFEKDRTSGVRLYRGVGRRVMAGLAQ